MPDLSHRWPKTSFTQFPAYLSAAEAPTLQKVFPETKSKIMAVFEETWEKAKSTIRERGIFMFNGDLLSDERLVARRKQGGDSSAQVCVVNL